MLKKAGRFAARYAYAVACSGYAFTIGLPRHRLLVYDICERFGWPAPDWRNRPPELLPQVNISTLTRPDIPVIVVEDRVSGNTSLLESLVINKLVAQVAARRVFEIGTFDGLTTFGMTANASEDAQVFTLDLPEAQLAETRYDVCENDKQYIHKPASGERFRGTPYQNRITQLFGDSASFDFLPYRGTMDVVFVDGSHAYDYVMSDSEAALALLRPTGGLVLWHDYGEWDGVTRALNELLARDPRFAALQRVKGTSLALLVCGRDGTF